MESDERKEYLKKLGLTIEKLDNAYGKGTTIVKKSTDEQIEVEKNRVKKIKMINRWIKFIHFSQSTELWEKEDFEKFLENREILLKTSYRVYEGYPVISELSTENEEIIEKNSKLLNALSEIYKRRFGKFEPQKKEKNYTVAEKFKLLDEIGFFSLPIYKNLSEGAKEELLSKLFSVHVDTIKHTKNNREEFCISPEGEKRVLQLLKKLNIKQ